MTRDARMWLVIMLLGAAGLIGRAVFSEQGMGREYVRVVPVAPNSALTQENASTYGEYVRAERASPAQTEYRFSAPRTVGLWVAAFFTLAVFSFLYRDNPFYKIAESVLVGVSAAYWMVVGFWDVLVPNLIGKIWPAVVQAWAMPGLQRSGSGGESLVHRRARAQCDAAVAALRRRAAGFHDGRLPSSSAPPPA